MKIIALVVTYNRLPLLKKCLNAIAQQSRVPDEVIVVNNSSTDGTAEWLAGQPVFTITQPNLGGAAGFSTGIKTAYQRGADWIWIMDDDTIPHANTLAPLVAALDQLKDHHQRIGFLSSKVLWIDGTIHKMNRSWAVKKPAHQKAFSFVSKAGLTPIQYGTFVSMLLSATAVESVGLPFKEFFIWCDDVEYAKRIIGSGLAGIEVPSSLVTHETPINHQSQVFKDPSSAVWKYRYGLRNELYTKRMQEGELAFWYTWSKRVFVWPFQIVYKRKSHRWAFVKVVWQTSMASLRFRPSIERVNNRQRLRA